eukprot:CAMPEP_0172410638 /NCGR_PEP_ID=MMETSP1061-20121228/76986_1 /TAXON_ID=37318 /ORGANISM="Pseudo-nitzschia pungens, Strain cf. pungens" /LENGTH=357 /DNA_ID=CAMNT_0013146831 /DNA_START=15 /DNA_END=1088 /DNA_ORIENTATION=-
MNNKNESRHRRKNGFRGNAPISKHEHKDEESGTIWDGNLNTKIHASSFRFRSRSLRHEKSFVWKSIATVVFGIWIIYQCQDYFDERLQDKYWRAMLLLPIRYLRVKWVDQRPTGLRKFTLRHDRSFVINLNVDKKRWKDFQQLNQKQLQNISRFAATSIQTKNDDDREYRFLEEYRFLHNLVKNEGKGSAGCAISHLKLLGEFVAKTRNDDEYIFVFEDDAVLTSHLLDRGFVIGPDNADFILLTEYSSAHIRVPLHQRPATRDAGDLSTKSMEENYAQSINTAVRVVSGYSAMGYVITRRAAQVVLDGMKVENHLPVDVYFFANPQIKAYLPLVGWPIVRHNQPHLSVRRDKNKAR